MDWELYDRYRSSAVLGVLILLSLLLLGFQNTSFVRYLKSVVVYCSLPLHRIVVHSQDNPASSSSVWPSNLPVQDAERSRTLAMLAEENERLHQALDLKEHEYPQSIPAHVIARQPQRWFKDLLIDKGTKSGISVDDPVITRSRNEEVLVGRVIEVFPQASRVMLIQDPLSAIPATIMNDSDEDGVLEGTGSHTMLLRYLSRDSKAKIGDLVATSGLGDVFPPGLALGRVESLGPDDRQLFLEAKLKPVTVDGDMRIVLVIIPPAPAPPQP